MTLGMGSLAMASSSAFCTPSASITPRTVEAWNRASALPSPWRVRPATASSPAPRAAQLLDQGGRGLAVGVQAHGDGHELLRHGLVLGLGQDFGDVGGQAARRGIGRQARFAGGQQALGLELLEQHAGKGVAQLLQRLRGQLFDKQFNKKIRCVHGLVFSRCSGVRLRRPSCPVVRRPWPARPALRRHGPWAPWGKPRRARLSI